MLAAPASAIVELGKPSELLRLRVAARAGFASIPSDAGCLARFRIAKLPDP